MIRGIQNNIETAKKTPLSVIFKTFLQEQKKCQIMLNQPKNVRIEGNLIGLDEFLTVIIKNAIEFNINDTSAEPKKLGTILLKGDNIVAIQSMTSYDENDEIT